MMFELNSFKSYFISYLIISKVVEKRKNYFSALDKFIYESSKLTSNIIMHNLLNYIKSDYLIAKISKNTTVIGIKKNRL